MAWTHHGTGSLISSSDQIDERPSGWDSVDAFKAGACQRERKLADRSIEHIEHGIRETSSAGGFSTERVVTLVGVAAEALPSPHVLVCGTERWRHYHVIRDSSVTILDMEPALWVGWNVRRVSRQGDDDWCGMSADSILAFKLESGGDGFYRVLEPSDEKSSVLRLEQERMP